MGSYVYTLRKKFKKVTVGDQQLHFACYEFAYKPSFWSTPRCAGVQEAAADRAFDACMADGVALAIHGKWEHVMDRPTTPVIEIRTSSYYDDSYITNERIIGYVQKVGREYVFVGKDDL